MKRLVLLLLVLSLNAEGADSVADPLGVTPAWAEQFLKDEYPALLDDSDNDHVMSVYYFGRYANRTLMGLERVRGDNYEQFFTLLVFEGRHLLGYYPHVMTFPSAILPTGEVQFPLGVAAHGQLSDGPWTLAAPVKHFEPLCQGLGALMQCIPWRSPALTRD